LPPAVSGILKGPRIPKVKITEEIRQGPHFPLTRPRLQEFQTSVPEENPGTSLILHNPQDRRLQGTKANPLEEDEMWLARTETPTGIIPTYKFLSDYKDVPK